VQRFSGFQASFHFEDIITKDEILSALIENAKTASSGMSNILIEGESGTGKELFAQAIHNYGPREKGPFIAINCGAIPRELIASELFGYAEGSFTGAKKGGNPGKFELASGGTLFLDEIGDMPFEQQSSLLRVIQDKKITRIGGNQSIPVDVRIICATNKNMYNEMKRGNFRQDLYYRLNVINFKIPPLRERRSDIMLLFNYFLQQEFGTGGTYNISHKAQEYLVRYNWPGNVRELYNTVERVVHLTQGGDVDVISLPQEILSSMQSEDLPTDPDTKTQSPALNVKKTRALYRQQRDESDLKRIRALLELHHGNATRVAQELGISRTTLYKKLKSLEL
jgi:transcriptional regulator with PAS, ATPase and Fis domain